MRILRNIQLQVRNFFGISSTEANAFLILLPLMIIMLLLFPFYHHFFPVDETDFSADREQLQNHIAELAHSNYTINDKDQEPIRYISSFDPNAAPFHDLITVGMDTLIAARIIKYRNSGGKFTFREDLKKIYGLGDSLYAALENKITLPAKPAHKIEAEYISNTSKADEKIALPDKAEMKILDINKMDSLTLIKFKGIGPVLSMRIIRYRDKLGGFIDTTQYKEVYGLKAVVLEQLFKSTVIEENFEPHTININHSDAAQLAQHPYISWAIARAIVAYRDQHGKFTSLEQLSAIKIINESTLDKIKFYLSL